MSADFSHYTNYKDDTSFSKVVFGSSAPVLEVEMNELQEIVDTKLKALHSIVGKCAFVQGAITLTNVSGSIYNVTVTNCTLIDEGFTVYVDSITSSNTTISSGANVYFMLTKARVTGADTLRKYGNTTGTTITNEICDSRIGAETTQREQIQVSLHITTDNVPNDTDVTVYLPIGTIFNGVFTVSSTVFSETMVDSINMLGTYKLNTSDFTADNITGVLPISKGGTKVTTLTDLKNLIGGTIRHGTCTTAGDVREKVVDLGDFPTGVSLRGIPYDNEIFFVTFTNTNTFSTVQNPLLLRVNRHEGENTFYESAQLFPQDVNIQAGYTYVIKYTGNYGFNVLGAFKNVGEITTVSEGGTGSSDKYTAYTNLALTRRQDISSVSELNNLLESGWSYFPFLSYPPISSSSPAGYIYTLNPQSSGNNLIQLYIPTSFSEGLAIRTARYGSELVFTDWAKIPTENVESLKNWSSITSVVHQPKSGSTSGYIAATIKSLASGGSYRSDNYRFTYFYRFKSSSNVTTDWTAFTLDSSGIGNIVNTDDLDISVVYVQIKVRDTVTHEVQTKEFEFYSDEEGWTW